LTVIVDIYEISFGDETLSDDPLLLFNQANTDTGVIGSLTSISQDFRGVTPFDLAPAANNLAKMRILKKTQFQVQQGETFTYQMRDSYTHYVTKNDVIDGSGFIQPRATKIMYIVTKPVGIITTNQTISLGAYVTRKYKYKFISPNSSFDGIGTTTA